MALNSKILRRLSRILGREGLLSAPTDLQVYEYDASLERGRPGAVVFPTSREQVISVVKLAHEERMPFVARGSGTNLSGGSIPPDGGLVVEFSRMNKILEIDLENLRAAVEPGLYNIELSNALAPYGYYYAPDPASQKVSTFGGNVGENAGGPHCLKYGVTSNHVLGLEVVLSDGEVIELGGKASDHLGYDLVGVLVGSEGTLGIITKIVVRIMRMPEAVKTFLAIYDAIEDAGESVSAIIAQGILPATLEMMDKTVIAAVEASLKAGYPLDAEAVLIIELDGLKESMGRLSDKVIQICREHGAREIKAAQTAEEREALWAGRRGAFGAIARVAPNYLVTDGTVPRNRLPEVLRKVAEIGKKYHLLIGNVLHAGDGNLHPLILFDERNLEEKQRVLQAGLEVLEACAEVGGTISGEHGIGLEKIPAMRLVCGIDDLKALRYVKDTFDPFCLSNPRKVLPSPERAENGGSEAPRPHRRGTCRSSRMKESLSFHDLPQEILSSIHSVSDSSQLASFALDGRSPKGVISVASLREIAELLKAASKARVSIIPRGSGTKMGWGNRPRTADLLLELSGLRRVLEYDPENLTVTAECGLPLLGLQEVLGTKGQFLPLDPSYFLSASLGGVVSCNAYGPKRLIYGTARDMVLGMKVALPDGSVATFGGRCVKNVSGYDLCKLFVGSLGTLGVIGEITFKVLPLPEREVIQVGSFWDPTQALSLSNSLLHSALFPAALEILDPPLASIWSYQMGISHQEHAWLLLIGWVGFFEDVRRLLREGQGAFSRHEVTEGEVCEDRKAQKGWEVLGHLPQYLKVLPESSVLLRISLPLTVMGEAVASWQNEISSQGLPSALLLRPGCGILYGYLLDASQDKEKTINALERMRKWSMDRGGSLIIENAPLWLKQRMDVWGPAGKELALMRRLKKHCDPPEILNPGRYWGGI